MSYCVKSLLCRCPAHNVHVYETVKDPKSAKPVEKTLKEGNIHRSTDRPSEHDYCDGTVTPPLPPRTYSLSPLLDKINNLSNNQEQKDQNPQVDSENTYQPLIPPRQSTIASEYQSLTQLKQRETKF